MRRLVSLVAILAVGCSASPGSTPGGGSTVVPTAPPTQPSAATATSQPSGASSPPSSVASGGSPAAGAAGLPAGCAAGVTALLTAIEPVVSTFDPAKASMGDLAAMEDAAQSKSMAVHVPYACTTGGLAWVSLGEKTPWDAVLAAAGSTAPGTVAFLSAVRDHRADKVAKVADFGVADCDAAVAAIKKSVKGHASGGSKDLTDMALGDGLKLLGLYDAYMHDVQHGACPPNKLGNAEYEFFGSMT
jgi:hypothetical protein